MEILAALGIKAFKKNFTLERKTGRNEEGPSSTPFDFETQGSSFSSGTGDYELSKCGGAAEVDKAETLTKISGNEAFQGKTVRKVFQNTVNRPARKYEEKAQRKKIQMKKALKVRIPKLNTNELSLKEDAFTCKHHGCKLGFALKESLKLHIKNLHPEKKPFLCNHPGCKSVFKSRRGLIQHVKILHPGKKLVKPYLCLGPDCAVRFRDNRALQDHLRIAHGAEKLTCDSGNCKTTFNYSRSLYVHKKLHVKNLHPEKKPYLCNHQGCQSTFKSRRALNRHVRILHPGEKLAMPYPCLEPDCAVRFRDNRSLQDHLRKAHGAKKLTCDSEICNYSCNYSRSLYVHKKKQHYN